MKTNTKFTLVALLLLVSAITLPVTSKMGRNGAASNPDAYGLNADFEPGLETPTISAKPSQSRLGAGGGGTLDSQYQDYRNALERIAAYKARVAKYNKLVNEKIKPGGMQVHGHNQYREDLKTVKAYEAKHPVAKTVQPSYTEAKKALNTIKKYRKPVKNAQPRKSYAEYSDAVVTLMKHANPNCQCGPIEEEQ